MRRIRKNPARLYSVIVATTGWKSLVEAAKRGSPDRDARSAIVSIEWALEKRHNVRLNEPATQNLSNRIEGHIEQLRKVVRDVKRGVETEAVLKLLREVSDLLRKDTRTEKPQPDTTFDIFLSIERRVNYEGIAQEKAERLVPSPHWNRQLPTPRCCRVWGRLSR